MNHLSIVVVGRNDNYGGDFKVRLQQFMNWTFQNLSENKIESEIIFVNYNYLSSSSILNFISWPESNNYVKIKIVNVPGSFHKCLIDKSSIKNVPVLEYIAKNIGIRRAKGKYILSANPDILIHSKLFAFFKSLKSNKYYRVNRCDYTKKLNPQDVTDNLKVLNKSISKIWFKGSETSVNKLMLLKYLLLWSIKKVENIWKYNTVKLEYILNALSIPVYYHNIEYKYHCNASGDFMLMHRKHWFCFKGYIEQALISLHLDSLMVLKAAFSGLKEHVFFYPIYHQEHARRYDAIKKTNDENHVKAYEFYKKHADYMVRNMSAIMYNDENWGFPNYQFKEIDL